MIIPVRVALARTCGPVLAAFLLAGCNSTGSPTANAARAVGFVAPETEAPDFIRQSRPPDLGPIPVSQPPSPFARPKTPEEVKRAEAEMDRIRAGHSRAARP